MTTETPTGSSVPEVTESGATVLFNQASPLLGNLGIVVLVLTVVAVFIIILLSAVCILMRHSSRPMKYQLQTLESQAPLSTPL